MVLMIALILCTFLRNAESTKKEKDKTKIGKNVLDYTESDVYRLLDQWDVGRY